MFIFLSRALRLFSHTCFAHELADVFENEQKEKYNVCVQANSLALSLALRQTLEATRKWP